MKKLFSLVVLVYFLSWLFVYKTGLNTFTLQSEDTIPAMFLPVSIIKDHTFYADKYYDMIVSQYPHPDDKDQSKGLTPFYFKKIVEEPNQQSVTINNTNLNVYYSQNTPKVHYISAFPVISGLLALPVYAVPLLLGLDVTWSNLAYLSHISAALILASCVTLMYYFLKTYIFSQSVEEKSSERVPSKSFVDRFTADKPLLLSLAYAFATINFSTLSQALWQHGPLQLFTLLYLIMLFKVIRATAKHTLDMQAVILMGVFYGLSIITRPTAVLVLPFIFLLMYQVLYPKPLLFAKALSLVLVGMVGPFLFFVDYNQKYYFSLKNQGYATQAFSGWLSSLPEGFAGLWLSPSKGILVYSPFFIFLGVSLYIIIKSKTYRENLSYLAFLGLVILHIAVLAKWKHWYGGWSFGYRMAADVLPFMILGLVPYMKSTVFDRTKKLFLLLIGLGVMMQLQGLIFFDGVWHAAYDLGFRDTSWLWSVKDSETFFNIRRVLVKLGLIARACSKCL